MHLPYLLIPTHSKYTSGSHHVYLFIFARKGVDIKAAKLRKGPHKKGNYNQAPLQADYAGAVEEPVTRRSPLLANALDRSSPRANG